MIVTRLLWIFMLLFVLILIACTYNEKEHFDEEDETISNNNVFIKDSCMGGRGAFAKHAIKRGQVIERCPLIIETKWDKIHDTDIGNYFFSSNKSDDEKVFALGYCALFNHDDENFNVLWEVNRDKKLITFTASEDIKKGEEMFVSYGPHYWSSRNLVPITCKKG